MRWLFVLLLVLNGFYFVWSQLEAPVTPKEIDGLASARPAGQDIRLLSERQAKPPAQGENCLYLGGFADRQALGPLLEHLAAAQVQAQPYALHGPQGPVHWLRVAPQSRELVGDQTLAELSRNIKDLKHQIMPCEGIATAE
ncbi:hypothetical protein [Pseudomonas typographi]|uniref:hypothetical protein n=1 Tax=Pseudomonas typographi TaxID=2715964 RepID=UPI001682258F|nr:hypothetical protein [Pseudomonas typographi]MBD1552994.1 hypothetical protein [Pseudomonas typographi]